MTEPVYFVVERTPRGESPAIYHDVLPDRLTRKIPRDDKGLPCEPAKIIYAVRLDTLRGAHRWLPEFLKKPLKEIYAEYCRRRDGEGELPASNLAGPPKKAEPRNRLVGDYWEPPARTWPDRPADPYGAAGEIVVDGKLVPQPAGEKP